MSAVLQYCAATCARAMRRIGAWLARARDAYEAAYEARPFLTAAATAGVLGGGGDIIAQKVSGAWPAPGACSGVDAACACCARAHRSSNASPRSTGGAPLPSPRLLFSTHGTIMIFFVATPLVYMPEFYIWSGAVKGMSVSESVEKLRDQYWESYVPCLA